MKEQLLLQAKSILEQGDFIKALELCKQYLVHFPQNADALHLAAICCAQNQNYGEAEYYIEQAITVRIDDAQLYNSQGNMFLRQNKNHEAITAFSIALKLKPDYTPTLNNLGNAYFNLNQLTEAQQHYQHCIKQNPNFFEGYFNLARVEIVQRHWQNAIDHLQHCLSLSPSHFRALTQLGQIYLQQRDWAKAQNAFTQSLEIYPQQANALAALGTICLQHSEFNKAIQLLETALALESEIEFANWHLATAYLAINDTKNALKHYLRELEINPHVECYYNIGILHGDQNHHEETIYYLQEALKLDANYTPALINLGATFLKMHRLKDAIFYYEKALATDSTNNEIAHILHALKQDAVPETSPTQFVSDLFDQYAAHYDQHLKEYLNYQAPQLISDYMCGHYQPDRSLVILDLGCGTGLSGAILKPYAKKLIGVDLSSKMLNQAKAKNLYDEMACIDINVALEQYHELDLIVAADVFGYIGKLDALFALVKQALQPNGLFIFTIEKSTTENYQLTQHVRYQHHQNYIEQLAAQYQFNIDIFAECTLREQFKKPVNGFFVVLKA